MARKTASTDWISRLARYGQAALRCAAAAMVVVVVLGATLGTADAKTVYNRLQITRAQYVKYCTGGGGTVEHNGSSTKCDFGGGTYTNCNFQSKKCSHRTPGLYPSPEFQNFIDLTHGDLGGGDAVDSAGGGNGDGRAAPPTGEDAVTDARP